MKKHGPRGLVITACVFAAFLLGFFAGRSINRTPVQIRSLPAPTESMPAPDEAGRVSSGAGIDSVGAGSDRICTGVRFMLLPAKKPRRKDRKSVV